VKILLAGFGPWGKTRRNPSGETARALGGHVLPVRFGTAGTEIVRLIRETRPGAIVLLGVAAGRRKINLEAVALNVDHCEDPPPFRRWRRRIRKGPFVRFARLPLDRIHRRLRAAGLPVALSYNAGTFLCNHVFYVALARSRVPCGFVHLPPHDRLSLSKRSRAIRIILDELKGGGEAVVV
jgi:pyroglutamyl-peptidase